MNIIKIVLILCLQFAVHGLLAHSDGEADGLWAVYRTCLINQCCITGSLLNLLLTVHGPLAHSDGEADRLGLSTMFAGLEPLSEVLGSAYYVAPEVLR